MDKQEALVFCQQLEVDRFVRKLARSGKADSAGINFYKDWADREQPGAYVAVRATFGAGTNTASVRLPDGTALYEADDYGRHVRVYRHGQWIYRLREDADEAERLEREAQAEMERRRAQAEAANFAAIDY